DAKRHAITLVSNRHLALENFQRTALAAAAKDATDGGPLFRALAGEPDGVSSSASAAGGAEAGEPVFADGDVRERVARRAARAADALDDALADALPDRYVADPDFEFGVDARGIDLYAQLEETSPAASEAMTRAPVPQNGRAAGRD